MNSENVGGGVEKVQNQVQGDDGGQSVHGQTQLREENGEAGGGAPGNRRCRGGENHAQNTVNNQPGNADFGAAAVTFLLATLSAAISSGTEISISWLIIDCILCMILSAATPPVPGGSTASFTILFTQLGLPMDSLAAVIALNLILDFVHTATNIFGVHCLALLSARKLGQTEDSNAN